MDRSTIILPFAIFALFLADLLFSELAYFSLIKLVALNILALISALAFLLAYKERHKKIDLKRLYQKIDPRILLAIIALLIIMAFFLVGIAALVTAAGLYLIAALSKKLDKYKFYSAVIIIILATSTISFISVSSLRNFYLKGVDEVAFNYYAAYVFVHGANPYTSSMQPIIDQYNLTPSYLMNGSIENAYSYPSLSFLPLIFMPLLGVHNFLVFIAIVFLISTFVAFFVYRKSGYNRLILVPLVIWLIITYLYMQTIGQYMAVALFFLIAYTERKNPLISGIFMGLAASTTQLSWFALPFLYVLILREQGKAGLLKSALVSLLVFLLLNGYFIIIAPAQFLSNVFSIFGASKLLLFGTNIMEVLVHSYGVPLWYPAVISLVTLVSLIILFYFYTDTLKPLIAIVPAFIFFLSWRNLYIYGFAFLPLIILLCYAKERNEVKDLVENKRYIILVLLFVMAFSLVLAIYAHGIYARQNTFVINSMVPVLQKSANGTYTINSIELNLTNNGNSYENVSFYLVNRMPAKDGFFLAPAIKSIAPHKSMVYMLNFTVLPVMNSTSIYVLAFSTDYIKGRQFSINLTTNQNNGK